MIGRQAGIAGQAHRAHRVDRARRVDLERVVEELAADHGGDAFEPRLRTGRRAAGQAQRRAPVGGQVEGDRRDAPWRGACTASTACCNSLRSPLRNLSRAGVAKNRSRTSTRVPGGCAAGPGGAARPPSTAIDQASAASRLAAGDGQPADRADRRQRLAAEAEGARCAAGRRRAASRWRGARPPAPARRASCRRRRRRRRSGCGRLRRASPRCAWRRRRWRSRPVP